MAVVLFRADATQRLGTGHVMRSMALAQACQDAGHKAVFCSQLDSLELADRIRAQSMMHISFSCQSGTADDAGETIRYAAEVGAGWVVVDGYSFSSEYERTLKDAGLSVLAIDDKGERDKYYADVVVNPNLHASSSMYEGKHETNTRLLLGSRYVLLRVEFSKWLDWQREISEEPCNVLVTLGGADPDNMTCKVLKALSRIGESSLRFSVVVGASKRYYSDIANLNDELGLKASVLRNVGDMPALMAGADIAISAGGTTVWELAYMSLPTLVGKIAPVEELLVAGLVRKNLFVDLGWFSEVSEDEIMERVQLLFKNKAERQRMAELGRNMVDGQGCERLLKTMCL